MRLSNSIVSIVLGALLVACASDGVNGDPATDGGLPGIEADASLTATPDATPVPDAGPPPVSLSQDIVPVLMARCGGCHLKAMGGSGGLSLGVQAELAYSALVDKPTHGAAAACSGLKLVDPTNADATQSSLYVRLSGATCGMRMPKGQPPLTDVQLELFQRWISQGAPNN
jgi:hypothetical protein